MLILRSFPLDWNPSKVRSGTGTGSGIAGGILTGSSGSV